MRPEKLYQKNEVAWNLLQTTTLQDLLFVQFAEGLSSMASDLFKQLNNYPWTLGLVKEYGLDTIVLDVIIPPRNFMGFVQEALLDPEDQPSTHRKIMDAMQEMVVKGLSHSKQKTIDTELIRYYNILNRDKEAEKYFFPGKPLGVDVPRKMFWGSSLIKDTKLNLTVNQVRKLEIELADYAIGGRGVYTIPYKKLVVFDRSRQLSSGEDKVAFLPDPDLPNYENEEKYFPEYDFDHLSYYMVRPKLYTAFFQYFKDEEYINGILDDLEQEHNLQDDTQFEHIDQVEDFFWDSLPFYIETPTLEVTYDFIEYNLKRHFQNKNHDDAILITNWALENLQNGSFFHKNYSWDKLEEQIPQIIAFYDAKLNEAPLQLES